MKFLWQLYQLHKLMTTEWLETSQIEEIQRRKLQKLLQHAYTNVPYYRQLLDSVGVKPEDIKTVADAGYDHKSLLLCQRLNTSGPPVLELAADTHCKQVTLFGIGKKHVPGYEVPELINIEISFGCCSLIMKSTCKWVQTVGVVAD